jgi:hypothetical protein
MSSLSNRHWIIPLGLAAAVLISLTAACGSSTSSESARPDEVPESTSTSTIATTTTAAKQSTWTASWTDPAGWTYAVRRAYQRSKFTFEKDLTASPPGSAVLAVRIDRPAGDHVNYVKPNNPGRPNGPSQQVWFGVVSYDVGLAFPTPYLETFERGNPEPEQSCKLNLKSFVPGLNGPELTCAGLKFGLLRLSLDMPEAEVDELVGRLNGQVPFQWMGIGSCTGFHQLNSTDPVRTWGDNKSPYFFTQSFGGPQCASAVIDPTGIAWPPGATESVSD